MARLAVFAYGSLVDPASASMTLERAVEQTWQVRLVGWRRRFSQVRDNRACEKTFARVDDGTIPGHVLGLNIERAENPGASVTNGTLVEVTAAELERLDRREIRYERVEIPTAAFTPGAPELDRVYSYVAREANFAAEAPAGAVILRSYARTVEAAFEMLGPTHHTDYLRSTLPYPVELIDARLTHDRIADGNPRDW